jgi:excinuclease ABC subunit C
LAVFNFYSSKANLPKKIFFASLPDELILIKKCIRDNISEKIAFPKTRNSFIKPIVSLAKNNAAQIIRNHLSKKEKYAFAYQELSKKLGTNKIERIDAFDISHQYMQQGVGSCVVFAESGPSKKDYRLFNIPNDIAGNDIASMEHVISRRLKYYEDQKPDLILIDGGRTQLNFTNKILKDFGMEEILVLGIAKGMGRVRSTETIYTNKGILEIDPHSESFKLLNEARDESHRFAITASRKKIRKSNKYSILDSVKGIGPTTKKALLKEFKSLKGIKEASKDDLMTIKNINETMALEIKQKL